MLSEKCEQKRQPAAEKRRNHRERHHAEERADILERRAPAAHGVDDCCGAPFSAVEINSGEKNPMPHRPIIPETPRNRPTMRVAAASADHETARPAIRVLVALPAAASAFALATASGSFRHEMIGTTRSARQDADEEQHPPARIAAKEIVEPGGICRLNSDPMMLPSAESACSDAERDSRETAPGTLRRRASSPRRTCRRCRGRRGTDRS